MTELGHRPVLIICYRSDINGYATRSITLISNLFVGRTFQLARALHDSPFDIIGRHIDGFSFSNRFAQPGIFLRVATSLPGGYADFPDQLGKHLTALGINSCFFMFYRMPF